MAQQVAEAKQQLAMGQQMQNSGTAASGWGLGTSPYAVNPAEAPNTKSTEERQGDKTMGDTPATRFDPLYAPEEFANQTYDTQAHGQLDLSQSPQKVEEIRSAPESQQALTAYQNVVGAYADGEEAAVQRERVPLQYQELVKQYFDQLKHEEQAAEKEKAAKQK